MFKVLRNGLLRYILYTCPKRFVVVVVVAVVVVVVVVVVVLGCVNVVCSCTHVIDATEWTASDIPYTCPNLM